MQSRRLANSIGIRSLSFSVSTLALILVIYGFVLQRTLQHGRECDMTWSVVRFICLPQPGKDLKTIDKKGERVLPYRLLKFTDGRDWRYQHLPDTNKPDKNDRNTYEAVSNINWCQTGNILQRHPGHIVLYVPGHDGQYQQARSLGAHGLNLTRHSNSIPGGDENDLLEELWDGKKNASAKDVDDFVFDVYAADFNGEGGGLHGSRLFAQSEFIAMSLERINEECGNEYTDQITVVAHSLGGLVARKAVLEVNDKRFKRGEKPLVRNLITLASPHSFIPLIFEPSVYRFHTALVQQEASETKHTGASFTLISISGGLRDELIPPSSCEAGKEKSLSFLASEVLSPRTDTTFEGQKLGMDHKAIVWCQGLLSVVRELIHTTIIPGSMNSQERISKIINEKMSLDPSSVGDCNFRCQNNQKGELLVKEYGLLGAFAIRTSTLSNCRALAILYTLNSGLYFCIGVRSCRKVGNITDGYWYLFIPLLSSALFVCFVDEIPIGTKSVIVLAFNAMNLYCAILYGIIPTVSWLLQRLARWRNAQISRFPPNKTSGDFAHEYTVKVYFKRQLWVALFLCIVASVALVIFSTFRKDSLVVNAVSAGSLFFLVLVALLILDIFHLGCWPKVDLSHLESQRSLASILLVVFPLSVIGKIIFALSLFTKSGQAKALSFMQFEELEWGSFCDKSNGLVCTSNLLKYDLVRFASLVCLPMLLVMMWIQCRPLKHWAVEMKKE